MPRKAHTTEKVESIKTNILETAADMILNQGYDNFSMRKLAKKLGMTAANIYNYFQNKDEIYLAIQKMGFELIYREFENVYYKDIDENDKLRELAQRYINFGLNNPNYYDIVFNLNTPKYTDYIGSEIEHLALAEKNAGLEVLNLAVKVLQELAESRGWDDLDPDFRALQLWTSLHGIVSLLNSRVFQEATNNPDKILQELLEDLFNSILPK